MKNKKDNLIVNLTTEFALMAIAFCETLESERKYVIARQLLRSATSIAASAREAQNAESTDDFIHKFKMAAKESEETDLWLYLCSKAPTYPTPPDHLTNTFTAIQKVVFRIIATTKKRRKK
jgi:four helix bundle protein